MMKAATPNNVRANRGFTLLEMIVATTIMGVAVTGLLAGLSGATRNAARLRDYERDHGDGKLAIGRRCCVI